MNADSTVRIVGDNPDAEVAVVGGQVLEGTPGDAGEFVVVNGDGTLGFAPGGSGGPPSGAAGGVLAGTYPNPSFAVDMATQAELNAIGSGVTVAQKIITEGNYGTGSVGTGWREPFTSGQDATVAAVAGDRLKVTVNANFGTSGGSDWIDAVTVTGGNHVGIGGATGQGMAAATNSSSMTVAPSRWYTVVSGDIATGNVAVRVKTRTDTGRTLYANADSPTVLIVENHGQ